MNNIEDRLRDAFRADARHDRPDACVRSNHRPPGEPVRFGRQGSGACWSRSPRRPRWH